MSIILTNLKLISAEQKLVAHEVKINEDNITEIANKIERSNSDQVIDCQGKLLSAGFIDVHVHLREPGGEEKETIATGTKAAARGGYTTICSMPNTSPVPDQPEVVTDIIERIKQTAHVNVLPYASITAGLKGEQLTDMAALKAAGAFAFTDDGVGVQTADQMLQAMEQAQALDMAIVAHCEDNSLIHQGAVHAGDVSKRLGINGIPSICESVQIARDVLLAEATGCHYHVCHVSTKESVRVIRDAKRAGIHVTAEVTPHHLLLNESAIQAKDTNFKMNPPLRAKEDQAALMEGLLDGTLDFIATDHAPHSRVDKAQDITKAPFGIVGLETAFALLYTHLVQTNKCELGQLIDWLTKKPAEVFNLSAGQIEVGAKADLVLLDLTKEWHIDKHNFYSKGRNTPFDQWSVTGCPVLTFVNGKIVYQEDDYVKATART